MGRTEHPVVTRDKSFKLIRSWVPLKVIALHQKKKSVRWPLPGVQVRLLSCHSSPYAKHVTKAQHVTDSNTHLELRPSVLNIHIHGQLHITHINTYGYQYHFNSQILYSYMNQTALVYLVHANHLGIYHATS